MTTTTLAPDVTTILEEDLEDEVRCEAMNEECQNTATHRIRYICGCGYPICEHHLQNWKRNALMINFWTCERCKTKLGLGPACAFMKVLPL